MLKETISYTDYDDQPQSKTLHFNISKVELADNLDMQEELQSFQDIFEGPEHQLTVEEVKRLLEMIKKLIKLSYGVREGDRFIKNERVWNEFTETAAYDAFMMSMFEDPTKAVRWMIGIIPKDIRDKIDTSQLELPNDIQELMTTTEPARDVQTTEAEVLNKTFEDYSREELLALSDGAFYKLVPQNPVEMTPEQMSVAYQRKNSNK